MASPRAWLLAVVLTAAACDAGEAGADVAADPETLALGETVYRRHCASCHGPEGKAAPGWRELSPAGDMPPPPHDSTGHTWRHSDALLFRIVDEGWRDPFNRTDRLTMPAFGGTLTPREIRAVIHYIKTLWTPEQRRFQSLESRGEPFPPLPASGG